MNLEQNCLSYWFPKLEAAGLPVPKTVMLAMSEEIQRCFRNPHDTNEPPELESWIETAKAAIRQVGGPPFFLRTGQMSGKHGWRDTCYGQFESSLLRNMICLVEHSECAGLFGLPYNVWAIRELLPTTPLLHCDLYGGMPACREFRFFVVNGEVQCWHPYWPLEALIHGTTLPTADVREAHMELSRMPAEAAGLLYSLASRAGEAVGGAWSVDILETRLGWYVTDMARAEDSWHDENCPLIPAIRRRAA